MNDNANLEGLGGWLILVGIGVVVTPFGLLATYLPLYASFVSDGTFLALTSAGSPAYHPLWWPILAGEMLFNSLMFVATAWLVYLFFSKHHRFPIAFIVISVVSVVFIVIDAWLVSFVLPGEPMFDQQTIGELIRSSVSAGIWIPYMLLSRRVKATFVELAPNGRTSPPVESPD